MARVHPKSRGGALGYYEKTHRPLNCLVFILPLLAAYEAGALFYHDRLLAPQHLAAVLEVLGASARFLPPLLIVAVLLIWHALTRQTWHVDAPAVGGMALESLLLTVPLFALGMLTSRLFDTAALRAGVVAHPGLYAAVLSGIGAGIYEEFLFRLAGFGLILLIFQDGLRLPKVLVTAGAVVLTSVVFSLIHFLDPQERFTWFRFVFRALAGAYLAGLYILRGFGVAAGAHAFYNVIVAAL